MTVSGTFVSPPNKRAVQGLPVQMATLRLGRGPTFKAIDICQVGKPQNSGRRSPLSDPEKPGFRPQHVPKQPISDLYLLWQQVSFRGRAPACLCLRALQAELGAGCDAAINDQLL